MRYIFVIILLITNSLSVNSQQMIGHHTTNYSGIYRATFNPSAIAGTTMKWQLNLVTLNSTINNRYFKYFASDALFHPFKNAYTTSEIYGKSKLTGTFTQGTNLNVWSELRGPSGFITLGKKNLLSVGFQTRMRGLIQGTGLPQVLADVYTQRLDFGRITASQGSFKDFTVNQQSFFESGLMIALAGGYDDIFKFKVGATVKRLSGARSAYLKINSAQYAVRVIGTDEALLDLSNINYEYGYTQPVKKFNIANMLSSSDYGAGGAFDAGLTLEFGQIKNHAPYRSNYIVRLGAAITDVGEIQYTKNTGKRYTGILSKLTQNQDNIVAMGDNLVGELEKTLPKTNAKDYGYTNILPTTLNLDLDGHITKSFFVNASLIKPTYSGTSIPTQMLHPQIFTITPRWEDQDAQFTLPVSWIEGNSTPTVGFSVRLGPAFIGFSNFSGMLKIHDPRGTFIYFGFQLFGLSRMDEEKK
jgi:Family of unknown function (DUF5723)